MYVCVLCTGVGRGPCIVYRILLLTSTLPPTPTSILTYKIVFAGLKFSRRLEFGQIKLKEMRFLTTSNLEINGWVGIEQNEYVFEFLWLKALFFIVINGFMKVEQCTTNHNQFQHTWLGIIFKTLPSHLTTRTHTHILSSFYLIIFMNVIDSSYMRFARATVKISLGCSHSTDTSSSTSSSPPSSDS